MHWDGLFSLKRRWLGAVELDVVPWDRAYSSKSANSALWSLSGLSWKLRIPLLHIEVWRRFVPKRKSMWRPQAEVLIGIVDLQPDCRL